MTDALRIARKAVSIAVTTTTIAWSVGIAGLAPLATHAATPGQLIKMAGNASVYYLHTDMKRYVFPNEPTYKSWYPDFSGVVTISQTELQSYTIGPTIVMRAGTKLGKVTTDPKVYAVEPGGVFRHVTTEAIAKTLYGDNWASRVVDIPDVFFSDYTVGSAITTNAYPTGTLIKMASSSDIYYVDGSSKRMITSGGLSANHFIAANAVTSTDAIFNALGTGSQITGAEGALFQVVAGAVSVPGGSGLTVTLAPDTPATTIQASGTAYNPALKVNLTASSDGAVNLTGLTLTRTGITQDSDISGVGVFDAAGVRHGNFVTFATQKAVIDFTSNPIMVPAGTTVSVWVKTNITVGVASGTYAVSVATASDVKTTANVSGSFPIMGNGFSLIDGATSVGTISVDDVTIATTTVSVDIGTNGYLLSKFKFTAGANEAISLKRVRMFNNGTVDDDDIQNYRLVDPNGVTISTVQTASNRYVDFVITNGYTIPEGNSRDLQVLVDVKDGSTRTAQMNVQNDYDIEAYGLETGSGLLATATGTNDTGFPVGDTTSRNHLTVQAGTLTVSKSTTSPTGEIGVNTSSVVVAIWDLEAKGEAIELQRVDMDFGGSAVAGDLTGNIKLQTSTGQTVASFTPASTDGAELFDGDGEGNDSQTLSSYLTIPSNTIVKVQLVVDTDSDISSGDTILGNISNLYFKRTLSNTYATVADTAFIAGNTLTATTNSLTVSTNAAYASQTLTAGQSDVKVGSFLLKTNNAEGVNITSIVVRLTAAGAVDAADISNLRIKRADTSAQLGNSIASPVVAAAANTFSIAGALNIPANTTVQIDIYANVASAAADGGTDDTLIASLNASDVSGVGANSGAAIPASAAATLQTLTFAQSGTLTISIDQSGAVSSQHYTPGLTGVEMARIKLATTTEGAKVQKLEVRSINGSGNIDSVKLLNTGLTPDPTTQISSGTATFTFSSGGEILVNSNSSKVLTVVANTTPLQSVVAGNFGVLGLGTADAIGSGSGVTIQESLTGTSYIAGTDAYSGDLGDVIYFTATADAGTSSTPGFYIVTTDDDAVNLATGDLDLGEEATDTSWTAGDVITKLSKVEAIAGNANAGVAYNVGDLVYVFDTDDNTGAFAIVTTAVASGSAISGLAFSPAGTIAISAATDLVTKFTNVNGLAGNTMRYEEVEPVITLTGPASGSYSPNAEQTVASFNIKAEGGRDMTFNSLTVEKNGSNEPYRYVSKLSLWNGATKIAEVATTSAAGVLNGDTLTPAVVLAGLEICTGTGGAVADEIGGITAAEYAKWAVGDKIVFSDGTDEISGTIATKTAITAGNCGADLNTADNLTFSTTSQIKGTANPSATPNIYNYMVHFAADQDDTNDSDLEEQTITAGQTMALTVKADTSLVKTGISSGTVTFGANIPGSTGPLQVSSTQIEGFNWDYTPLGTGTAAYRTEADGYPIIGNTLSY